MNKILHDIAYMMTLILTLILTLIMILSCDDGPPVVPEPDPVMGCKVEGEISVLYSSGKGFIGVVQNDKFQYYFSSYNVINGKEYGLLISLFPENPADTSGFFPIVSPENVLDSGNYAFAAFVVDNEKPTEIQFWAVSGELNIDYVSIGKQNNKIVGTFSFMGVDKGTGLKQINVTEGWVNLVKFL